MDKFQRMIKWIIILLAWDFVLLLWLFLTGCSEPSELDGYYTYIQVDDDWTSTQITIQRGYYFFEDLEPQRYDSLATDSHGNTVIYAHGNTLTINR